MNNELPPIEFQELRTVTNQFPLCPSIVGPQFQTFGCNYTLCVCYRQIKFRKNTRAYSKEQKQCFCV